LAAEFNNTPVKNSIVAPGFTQTNLSPEINFSKYLYLQLLQLRLMNTFAFGLVFKKVLRQKLIRLDQEILQK
jgi:hypothetical protein